MSTVTVTNFPYLWGHGEAEALPLPEVLKQEYPEIRKILLEQGAILFRNFGIDHPQKLEECVDAFPGKPINYAGGNSPRTNLHGNVYTSTEQAAHTFISLHNELSYASSWPTHIFFCCERPASEGGHTIIADSRNILQGLSAGTVRAFREKGVRYIRNLHGGFGAGPSWQDTFETEDVAEVERHCRANDIIFEWQGTKRLRLIEKRQAIIRHPDTQEEVWFNQADQFHPSTNSPDVYEALMEIYEDNPQDMPQYVCFDDGTDIPLAMLDEIREVGRQNTAYFDWEQGGLLLLDNVLAAHGRTPYQGPRKILAAMVS